ncbi:hypothetical protein SO802_023687 [Lithocarpus litseifolius]|uniref:DUF4283 domain-containing protein n=1 Tax=Lithocarpus litseifolius TaxID=425828 RepID=A0AAW2C705_9ROSI
MADEMTDRMNKLGLTLEEEEIIAISDEGRLEVLESCNLSLIGKFLTCKPFNKMAAKNTIRRAWGVDDAMQILETGPNLFQFRFRSEFEMDRILKGGPWSFDNQLLMLQRWKKGMTVGNIKMETALLWVQIWGAPLDMISPQVAKQIGGRLGEVEEVEWKKKKDDVSFFMRVRVALPISKPLRRGGFIAGTDGERYWVDYKYERLPFFCHYYAVEKNGGVGEYWYGEFLRAVGGRTRGSASQSTGNNSSSVENASRDNGKAADQKVQSMMEMVATRDDVLGNPSMNDKEASENPGKLADSMVSNVVQHTNGMAVVFGNNWVNPSVVPSMHDIADSHTGFEEELDLSNSKAERADFHMDGLVLGNDKLMETNGLSLSRPKATWTRINRMDFGLGGLARALTLPSLGKRDTRSDQDEDYQTKKGRMEGCSCREGCDVEISAGVDSHPCRKQ